MAHEKDRASSSGTFVGILTAALFIAVLFAGYTIMSSETPSQSSATNTEQTTPAPNASPQVAPPASQTSPDGNPPRDGESNSQNAN